MGKTPKKNMIATRYQDRELFAGGVFAAANHVASFCRHVDVITVLVGPTVMRIWRDKAYPPMSASTRWRTRGTDNSQTAVCSIPRTCVSYSRSIL